MPSSIALDSFSSPPLSRLSSPAEHNDMHCTACTVAAVFAIALASAVLLGPFALIGIPLVGIYFLTDFSGRGASVSVIHPPSPPPVQVRISTPAPRSSSWWSFRPLSLFSGGGAPAHAAGGPLPPQVRPPDHRPGGPMLPHGHGHPPIRYPDSNTPPPGVHFRRRVPR